MVEVFKTNVQDRGTARTIVHYLHREIPDATINFDLEDCDKILRISNSSFMKEDVVRMVLMLGHYCEVLE